MCMYVSAKNKYIALSYFCVILKQIFTMYVCGNPTLLSFIACLFCVKCHKSHSCNLNSNIWHCFSHFGHFFGHVLQNTHIYMYMRLIFTNALLSHIQQQIYFGVTYFPFSARECVCVSARVYVCGGTGIQINCHTFDFCL